MQQTSFNFGPSHNTKDPNTSTASSSGIDDLVSKLGSLLLGSNTSNDQMANSMKNAVKDGIVEAKKEDARINDSEEREAERRHKELMQHLSRIASLGGNNKIGGLAPNEKEKGGFGLLDALKWGGVAAGVLGLVTNFGDLIKIFDDTTKKVGDFKDKVVGMAGDVENLIPKLATAATSVGEVSTEILGMIGNVKDFGKTMGDLVDKAFTPEGAVGALLAAFIPGGAIAKAIFALFGATAAGNVFNQGAGNTNGTAGTRTSQSQIDMLMSQTNNMNTGKSQAEMLADQIAGMNIGSAPGTQSGVGINPIAATAAGVAAATGGGGAASRAGRGVFTYLAVDAIAPGLDENGNPKKSLLERSKNDIVSIYEANRLYNDDGTRNRETSEGLSAAAAVAGATFRAAPKNVWGAAAAIGSGIAAYDWANDDVSIVEGLRNRGINTPTLPDMSVALGFSPPDNPYSRKIKEYDEQIDKLEKELTKKLKPAKTFKDKEANYNRQKDLVQQIKSIKEKKSQYDNEINENNNAIIAENLKVVPEDESAGNRELVSGADWGFVGIGTLWGATVGATAGAAGLGAVTLGLGVAPGAAAGAVIGGTAGAVTSTVQVGAFNTAMNALESYIAKKYNRKIDVVTLAISQPSSLWNILVQYASENKVESIAVFAGLALGVASARAGVKILAGMAKKFVGGAAATASPSIVKPVAKVVATTVVAGQAANALGKQKTILNNPIDGENGLISPRSPFMGQADSVLNTPNNNIHSNNPTIAPLTEVEKMLAKQMEGMDDAPTSTNRPTVEEMLAKQNEGMEDIQTTSNPIPSGIPVNPSGQPTPVNADTNAFRTTGDLLSGKRAAGHVDVANLNADYATNLAAFIKDAEAVFGDKIEISSAYRPPTQKEKDALRSTATTQEELYRKRKPGGAPVAEPYKSRHGFGDGSDIYLKQFRNADGMNTMTSEQLKQWKALAAKHQLEIGDRFGENWHVYGDNGRGAKGLKGEEYAKNISQNSLSSAIGGNYAGDLGPMGNLIAQILRTESNGGNPNAYWGDASGDYKDLLGGKQVSEMTFDELKEFQKKLTQRTKGHVPNTDKGTSAAGIGQWVGSTLFGQDYNDTGFLKDYFGHSNYGNEKFDLDRQKDMFKSFLKSPKYGNLEGFINNPNMSIDSYAAHLGGQWQGVQKPEEQAKLKTTLAELRKTPDLNIDQALNKVMASMSNLSEKTGDFKKMFNGVADQITDAFSSIKDFLSDVTNKAGELLPQEFKDLFDLPAMKEFLDPFLGGESKSTLAHPKRTFSSLESQELRNLLMGTPNISGEQLAASSSALKTAEQRANQQQLGAVINTSSGNGGEAIHGQQIAGLSGNINTHFPGDIDAISARIYQWTDAPMFYAAGKMV